MGCASSQLFGRGLLRNKKLKKKILLYCDEIKNIDTIIQTKNDESRELIVSSEIAAIRAFTNILECARKLNEVDEKFCEKVFFVLNNFRKNNPNLPPELLGLLDSTIFSLNKLLGKDITHISAEKLFENSDINFSRKSSHHDIYGYLNEIQTIFLEFDKQGKSELSSPGVKELEKELREVLKPIIESSSGNIAEIEIINIFEVARKSIPGYNRDNFFSIEESLFIYLNKMKDAKKKSTSSIHNSSNSFNNSNSSSKIIIQQSLAEFSSSYTATTVQHIPLQPRPTNSTAIEMLEFKDSQKSSHSASSGGNSAHDLSYRLKVSPCFRDSMTKIEGKIDLQYIKLKSLSADEDIIYNNFTAANADDEYGFFDVEEI